MPRGPEWVKVGARPAPRRRKGAVRMTPRQRARYDVFGTSATGATGAMGRNDGNG